jgi:hypothetical protein
MLIKDDSVLSPISQTGMQDDTDVGIANSDDVHEDSNYTEEDMVS